MQFQWTLGSPIGPIYLVATQSYLLGVFWEKQPVPTPDALDPYHPAHEILLQTEVQLNEYFRGERKSFELPLAPSGTRFQQQVWKALREIPHGETRSYKDIAAKIENVKATRAIGTANGKNPYSIIVPCHRVIAASGKIGGYAGGLEIKSSLLQLEKGLHAYSESKESIALV